VVKAAILTSGEIGVFSVLDPDSITGNSKIKKVSIFKGVYNIDI
jgi:hypothetical protein